MQGGKTNKQKRCLKFNRAVSNLQQVLIFTNKHRSRPYITHLWIRDGSWSCSHHTVQACGRGSTLPEQTTSHAWGAVVPQARPRPCYGDTQSRLRGTLPSHACCPCSISSFLHVRFISMFYQMQFLYPSTSCNNARYKSWKCRKWHLLVAYIRPCPISLSIIYSSFHNILQ